jgi:hypothetical protein
MRLRRFVNLQFKKKFGKNVHEVAQSLTPESRTVYVDNDRCKSSCAHAARRLVLVWVAPSLHRPPKARVWTEGLAGSSFNWMGPGPVINEAT